MTIAGHSAADRDCGAEFRRDKVICDMRQDFACLRRVFDESQRCFAEQEAENDRENARAEQEKARREAENRARAEQERARARQAEVDRSRPSTQVSGTPQNIFYEKDTALDAGKCKIVTNGRTMMFAGTRLDWNGPCTNGLADGQGIFRVYHPNGALQNITRQIRANGLVAKNGSLESYGIRAADGKITKTTPDPANPGLVTRQEDFPPSQVPAWAREITAPQPQPSTQTAQAPAAPAASSTNSNSSYPSQSSNSGGAVNYGNMVGVMYGNDYLMAELYIVPNDTMLRSQTAVMSELFRNNRVDDPTVRTEPCSAGAGNGPYVALVHYQSFKAGSDWGAGCGSNSPEEAYLSAQRGCEINGGKCRVQNVPDFTRTITILDRRVAVGRPGNIDKQGVVVFNQDQTDATGYAPGHRVSWTKKMSYSEGYICDWRVIGGRWQMVISGPFSDTGRLQGQSVSDFVKGRYEFNCRSKG